MIWGLGGGAERFHRSTFVQLGMNHRVRRSSGHHADLRQGWPMRTVPHPVSSWNVAWSGAWGARRSARILKNMSLLPCAGLSSRLMAPPVKGNVIKRQWTRPKKLRGLPTRHRHHQVTTSPPTPSWPSCHLSVRRTGCVSAARVSSCGRVGRNCMSEACNGLEPATVSGTSPFRGDDGQNVRPFQAGFTVTCPYCP